MGMMVGTVSSGRSAPQVRRTYGAATVSFSKPEQKKTKRLNYSFKKISSQIMLSKTSNSASKVVTKARAAIASLLRKTFSDDYDDQELEHAIIHARKMERVAKKRVKNLKKEEEIRQKGSSDEMEEGLENAEDKNEDKEVRLSEEELQRMMEEYKELMEESMQEMAEELMEESATEMAEELNFDEMSDELEAAVHDMDSEDLERLKKKHRSDEAREIMDADMKYLRAFFQKLEKELEALSDGIVNNFSGVSFELSGLQMPVSMPDMPAMVQGECIDLML